MNERALTLTLVAIALMVAGTWLFIVLTDPERAPAVTVVLTSICATLATLIGKLKTGTAT